MTSRPLDFGSGAYCELLILQGVEMTQADRSSRPGRLVAFIC